MKKILNLSLLLLAILAFSQSASAQKKIKEGSVKFELDTDQMGDSPEMAMLGGTTLDFYFSAEKQRMEMNMMGGMMKIQTIVPVKSPKDAAIFMDMLGQKIQLVGLSEDDLKGNYNMMDVDNISSVTYDEKDKKEIAGYPCYKATLNMSNGMTAVYYITEKIQPPVSLKGKKDAVQLKGYPLEMVIEAGQGIKMVFKAKEVSDKLPENVFAIPEGYQKMTMAEFEE